MPRQVGSEHQRHPADPFSPRQSTTRPSPGHLASAQLPSQEIDRAKEATDSDRAFCGLPISLFPIGNQQNKSPAIEATAQHYRLPSTHTARVFSVLRQDCLICADTVRAGDKRTSFRGKFLKSSTANLLPAPIALPQQPSAPLDLTPQDYWDAPGSIASNRQQLLWELISHHPNSQSEQKLRPSPKQTLQMTCR